MQNNYELVKTEDNLRELLRTWQGAIQTALPAHLKQASNTFKLALIKAVSKSPQILNCTKGSIYQSFINSVRMGLEPNTPMQYAYLIPYAQELTLQVGYKGFAELARRAGVKGLFAATVHQGDYFKHILGSMPRIDHEKKEGIERNQESMTHVYAGAMSEGTFEIMTKSDIEKHKIRFVRVSKKTGKIPTDSPWSDKYNYLEMAKKTVFKRYAKYLPQSEELSRAIVIDDAGELGKSIDPDKDTVKDVISERLPVNNNLAIENTKKQIKEKVAQKNIKPAEPTEEEKQAIYEQEKRENNN